ncbi:MAG: polyphosphate kinase 2 [Flavobacteriaceae bacterium]|jgi:polyphosphate kinase 2|nr:polyphosphate kinase 2 [Flavobacteriaceae bacterium]
MELITQDLELLNAKKGLLAVLNEDSETLNIPKSLRYIKYEKRLAKLQEELIKLQAWVVQERKKVVVIFEGRDAAGKGGAIRRIVQHLNPREYRVVALPKPDEIEKGQWYFQRYINQLPRAGELVFFDRSWYNRAIVEPVNKFCNQREYQLFMSQVNDIEKMWIKSGIYLIKFYFSISKEEQAKRFEEIKVSPIKKWKYSPVDQKAQKLWDIYTEYKKKMFQQTDTKISPWVVINANRKTKARIEALEYILNKIPYKVKNEDILKHEEIEFEG